MYLTAQRVYSLARKKTGINAFLYRHGAEVVPGMSWDRPVVELIADHHIGTRGPEHVEIAPGGNRVVSFVDIVAADDTPIKQVEDAVRSFGANISPERLPVSNTIGTVAIRFGAQSGLVEDKAREEFEQIADQALNLLKNPREPAWRTQEPLEVDVEQTEEGLRFTLREEAKRRLATIHGPAWRAPRISISHDTRDAFELAHGDVFRNFVPILAELDMERVADLGGMRFYRAHTDRVLAEWPRR
ncbi:MAG TPA: hypothetical protein VLS89_11520 [Candidatus Nanopelagicales bacterium]|nr:hypothetical protein [Candidatus Nanopelagicales bacterium]